MIYKKYNIFIYIIIIFTYIQAELSFCNFTKLNSLSAGYKDSHKLADGSFPVPDYHNSHLELSPHPVKQYKV